MTRRERNAGGGKTKPPTIGGVRRRIGIVEVPKGWDNFYYLIGSAAGGLIGLMFVVVTLTAGRDRSTMLRAADLYLTPTVVHFAVVLTTSAVALIPDIAAPS